MARLREAILPKYIATDSQIKYQIHLTAKAAKFKYTQSSQRFFFAFLAGCILAHFAVRFSLFIIGQ